MKLDLSAMRAVTKGVMEVTEKDGVFRFDRFTAEQKSIYPENTGGWRRSEALASVVLDFETDGTALTYEAVNAWNSTGVRYYYFDLFIGGRLRYHDGFSYNPNEDGSTMMRFGGWKNRLDLGEGTKRVRLYLPAICHVELKDVVVEGATFVRPVPSKYRWLAFGDSITEAHSSFLPSMQYTEQVARALDAQVLNHGTGGEQYRADKIRPGTYPKVDFITVAYGTNDFSLSPGRDVFLRELRGFYKALHEEFGDTPVFALLPLWRKLEENGTERNIGTMAEVRRTIREEAQKYPAVHVVDCSGFIPPVADFFTDKTLHPNALGHTFYAKGLLEAMEKVLK